MSPYAWQEVINRVRSTWGRNKSDAWEKAETLYRQDRRIQTLSKESAMSAVGQFVQKGGTWPPGVPEVLKVAAGASVEGFVERLNPSDCGHEVTGVSGCVEICVLCLREWDVPDPIDQPERTG